MTFVNLLKRKRDRVGLEPVFDFQWHPLKNKTYYLWLCSLMGCSVWKNSKTYSGTTVTTSQERLYWNRKTFLEFTQGLTREILLLWADCSTADLVTVIITYHYICTRGTLAGQQWPSLPLHICHIQWPLSLGTLQVCVNNFENKCYTSRCQQLQWHFSSTLTNIFIWEIIIQQWLTADPFTV